MVLLAIAGAYCCISRRRMSSVPRKPGMAAPGAGMAVDIESGAGSERLGARQLAAEQIVCVGHEDSTWLGQLHRTSLEEVSSQVASAATEMVSLSSAISASLDQAEQLHSVSIIDDRDQHVSAGAGRSSQASPDGSDKGAPAVCEPVDFVVRAGGDPRARVSTDGESTSGLTSASSRGQSTWFLWPSAGAAVGASVVGEGIAGGSAAGTSCAQKSSGGTSSCSSSEIVSGSASGLVRSIELAQAHGLASAGGGTSIGSTMGNCSAGSLAQRSRLLTRPEAAPTAAEPTPGARGGKRWAAFISHFKVEAAMEARFLQTELEVLLGRKCFLDSDDLRDLRHLQQSVRDSDCLIIVQSKSILSRPYCLLEMVTAIEARVPIVGVSLAIGRHEMYKFELAPAFLAHLERTLEQSNPGASGVLTRANVELGYASRLLASTIPEIISIQFNPSASRNMLAASVADVASAMEAALPMRVPSPEEWERQLAVTPAPPLDWNVTSGLERRSPPSPTASDASSWRTAWPFRKRPHRTWAPANGRN